MITEFKVGKQCRVNTLICKNFTTEYTRERFIGKIKECGRDRAILRILLGVDVEILSDKKGNLTFRNHVKGLLFTEEDEEEFADDDKYREMISFMEKCEKIRAGQLYFDFYEKMGQQHNMAKTVERIKPIRHIPESEIDLRKVNAGDLVQISIEDNKKRRRIWTLFTGNSQGIDSFMAQERFEPSEIKLIVIYTSPRNTHKYYGNLGVELNGKLYGLRFIGPRREKYNSMVEKLKEADLWRDE